MEYESEEQQVEALKEWWAENGRAVIAGVVLGGSAIAGWTFWQGYQEKQTVAASDAFSQAIESLDSEQPEQALELASTLQDDNPKHLYTSYTNFAAARVAVENNDLDEAQRLLEWVADNAPLDDVSLIARVRLARVLGGKGDAAAGLDALPGSFPESFTGLVEEVRGDLLFMTGDIEGARSAYQSASESQHVANREGLNMKLEDLALPEDEPEDGSESTS